MKSTFYFDHDYNARNDLKVLQLRAEKKLEGYGLFWMIVEVMAEQGGYIKREALAGLSIGLNLDLATLKQFIDYCLEIELFYEDDNGIYSKRILQHLNFRETLSIAGKLGGRGNKREAKGGLKPGLKEDKATPKAGKESKGEESIEKQSKEDKEKEFRKQVFSFQNKYSDKMLLAFFNYWSEKSRSGRMRWEMEKTYEIEKRLATWHSREKEEKPVVLGINPFDMIPQ